MRSGGTIPKRQKLGVGVLTSTQVTEEGGYQIGGQAEPQEKLKENQTSKNERIHKDEMQDPRRQVPRFSAWVPEEQQCSYKDTQREAGDQQGRSMGFMGLGFFSASIWLKYLGTNKQTKTLSFIHWLNNFFCLTHMAKPSNTQTYINQFLCTFSVTSFQLVTLDLSMFQNIIFSSEW